MEAVILIENSGFFTDAVVTDGAQWNRGMWKELKITPDQPYFPHFADDTRKLYFFSDFPHLIKCMWHWLVNHGEISVS